jgi:hypothetical protein
MLRSRQSLALFAGVCLLSACRGSEEQPTAVRDGPGDQVPALPVVEPPLDREALLLRVVQAASDFALGRVDQDDQRELDGKRFAVSLRFGCPGDEAEARSWRFDERSRVLRIRIESDISGETPLISAVRSAQTESVEGFWLLRPWMLEPACPATRSPASHRSSEEDPQPAPTDRDGTQVPAPPATPERPEPRVGIAQFFTADDSRAQRRNDRAYDTTVKLEEGQRPSGTGYDLVLSGRLSALPDGRVIVCVGGAQAAPSCVVSATLDHVAVASPAGETLAEWSRS